MRFRIGDLVEYNSFEAGRRGNNKVMLVIGRFLRVKREGSYYRTLDGDTVTMCHESQIQHVGSQRR